MRAVALGVLLAPIGIGGCTTSEGSCGSNDECGSGFDCIEGRCRAPCNASSDCLAQHFRNSGVCEACGGVSLPECNGANGDTRGGDSLTGDAAGGDFRGGADGAAGDDALPPSDFRVPGDAQMLPQAVVDLQVVSTTTTLAELQWTGANDGLRGPAKYEVRYAATPPSPFSWGAASPTAQSVTGTSVGGSEGVVFTGLSAGTSYEFRLVSYRGTLNVDAVFGPFSNDAAGQTDVSSGVHPNEPGGYTPFADQPSTSWPHPAGPTTTQVITTVT